MDKVGMLIQYLAVTIDPSDLISQRRRGATSYPRSCRLMRPVHLPILTSPIRKHGLPVSRPDLVLPTHSSSYGVPQLIADPLMTLPLNPDFIPVPRRRPGDGQAEGVHPRPR